MDLNWIFKTVYFESIGGERIEQFTQQFAKQLGRENGAEVRTLSSPPKKNAKLKTLHFLRN